MNYRWGFCLLVLVNLLSLPVFAADPLSFEEMSLLLRIGERPDAILREAQSRKLLRQLTPTQVGTLKNLGISDVMLKQLQSPGMLADPDTAANIESKRTMKERTVSDAESATAPPQIEKVPEALPIMSGGNSLLIEKIVIIKEPVKQPFYVFFKASANAGRSEVNYNAPGKKYSLDSINRRVEIPIGQVLHNVKENDWATVTLHLDSAAETVSTASALRKHTGRIPITNKPIYAYPYSFDPPRATFIISLNVNQEFVYEVYWKLSTGL